MIKTQFPSNKVASIGLMQLALTCLLNNFCLCKANKRTDATTNSFFLDRYTKRVAEMSVKVRILREDPNSINKSSQFVSYAEVSEETALVFEGYKKGRTNLQEAQTKIDELSEQDKITVPFSVYVNVHANHASVFFFQSDRINRDNSQIEETNKLLKMKRGLRVFFCENSFQVINPIPVRRVDLFSKDGHEYEIGLNGDRLKPGVYKMFKCFEVVGISDVDIEWAYLKAAQDWYDTAANNCLTFSKRIICELHRHIIGEDVGTADLKKLNKLYISMPGESSFEYLRSRVSFFLTPSLGPYVFIMVVIIIVAVYVEIRLRL